MGKLHFLDVGCADTSIIVTSANTYLIDCYNIENYYHLLPKNKKIKALFITHQHYDHFLGMKYLLDNNYTVDYLIYSPYKRRNSDNSVSLEEWRDFNSFEAKFMNSGSAIYTPYRQSGFNKPWWEPETGLKFWIIGPDNDIANSSTRELHDACLVIAAEIGTRKCVFTGDASDTNLKYIADNTENYCNDILHASHHGSYNGADLSFIKNANAKYTVISTKSGVHQSVPDSTALQRYRSNTQYTVYRTDTGGTVIFDF